MHINKQSDLFVNNIGSVYVENISDKIIEELKKVTILITNDATNFSLDINEISLIEGTNSQV